MNLFENRAFIDVTKLRWSLSSHGLSSNNWYIYKKKNWDRNTQEEHYGKNKADIEAMYLQTKECQGFLQPEEAAKMQEGSSLWSAEIAQPLSEISVPQF